MFWSRRSFLKLLALFGGAQLAGCLGNSDSEQAANPQVSEQATGVQPIASPNATTSTQSVALAKPDAHTGPAQQPQNTGPVWDPAPSIQFVEGVPTVISVRQFVQDPQNDPLVIQLRSGVLSPGMTWNPNDGTIAYDGRLYGATPDRPISLIGVTFSADDRKN